MSPLPSSHIWRVVVAITCGALLLSACASSEQSAATQSAVAVTQSAVAVTEPVVAATSAPTTVAPVAPTAAAAGAEREVDFEANIFEISGQTAERLTHSWREGCPVGLEELRLVAATHWGYDGQVQSGELIVHSSHADDIVQVLSRLFDAEFPIERMELVDNFSGDDNLSMEANNTSAFNCREVASNPGSWSQHAFGAAIDINPVANPYLRGDMVLPPAGAASIDRSTQVVGGIYAGDEVTQAFAEIGWAWGGEWNSVKDWQHFSASGN